MTLTYCTGGDAIAEGVYDSYFSSLIVSHFLMCACYVVSFISSDFACMSKICVAVAHCASDRARIWSNRYGHPT